MSLSSTLLDAIERFLRRHDMAATTFGAKVVNDARLVERLRGGGDVRTRQYERIMAWMAEVESSGRSPFKGPRPRRCAPHRENAA